MIYYKNTDQEYPLDRTNKSHYTFRLGKFFFGRDAMLNKKCFVLDLDGTVYLGDIPIRGTVDFILRHQNDIDFY